MTGEAPEDLPPVFPGARLAPHTMRPSVTNMALDLIAVGRRRAELNAERYAEMGDFHDILLAVSAAVGMLALTDPSEDDTMLQNATAAAAAATALVEIALDAFGEHAAADLAEQMGAEIT